MNNQIGGYLPVKMFLSLLIVMALFACGQPEALNKIDLPTVKELMSNPERLKELRQQCKLERAKMGDELCNRVAEATRKRFYGDGENPYTSQKSPPES